MLLYTLTPPCVFDAQPAPSSSIWYIIRNNKNAIIQRRQRFKFIIACDCIAHRSSQSLPNSYVVTIVQTQLRYTFTYINELALLLGVLRHCRL